MIGFKPRPFVNITPINSPGITVVDLGELHEGAREGVEVPRSSSLPPVSVSRSHGMGGGRHASLPPMTPATISGKITSRMPIFDEEEVQEVLETSSDESTGYATSSQRGPEGASGEVPEVPPLRNSQVSKAKK